MDFNLKNLTPDVRHLNDMRAVLRDKDFAKNAPDMELYYMYRKVKVENGLNYNITIIPAKMLGEEFAKTKGHIHIGNFGEVYHVLEGEAIFLMQKIYPVKFPRSGATEGQFNGAKNETVDDVYAVKAKRGEAVIIPAGYGHITINPSASADLKTEDWSSVNCRSDYSLFEKLNGACYYYAKNDPASAKGFCEAKWIKNENYKSIPELRFEKPLKEVPKNLDFLK